MSCYHHALKHCICVSLREGTHHFLNNILKQIIMQNEEAKIPLPMYEKIINGQDAASASAGGFFDNASEATTSALGFLPAGICAEKPLDLTKHRIIPTFYIVLCIIGVLGNGVVIKVLWTLMDKNHIKSVTDILVLNLAVADFIFVSSLPFWATDLFLKERWVFGTVGCKSLSFITLLNLYGSVFFLVAMGIDRYMAVVFAVRARNYRTPRNAKIFCVVIWLFASLIGMEALVFREINVSECFTNCVWNLPKGDGWKIAYFVLRVLLGFVLPFIVLVFCYVFIMVRLSNMAKSSRVQGSVTSNQQKITRAILAVISFFVGCWLPNHIITVMIAVTMNDGNTPFRQNLLTANLFSAVLAYANSSINPILYAFMKTEIRDEGAKLFKQMLCFHHDETGRKQQNGPSQHRLGIPLFLQTKFSFLRPNGAVTHSVIPSPDTKTSPVTKHFMVDANTEKKTLCDHDDSSHENPEFETKQENLHLVVSSDAPEFV